MTEFEQGVLYAASVIIAIHDEPVIAATVVREAGLSETDCTTLDDFDKNNLRKLQGEQGIALRGLAMTTDDNAMLTNPAITVCPAPQHAAAAAALALMQSALNALTPQERARVVRSLIDAEADRERGYTLPSRPALGCSHWPNPDDLI